MRNNIEIYIDGHLMDMADDTNIALSKSFDAVEDVFEVVEAEYSYEFDLPATYDNRKVFGFTDTFDVPSKFDKLYKGQLYASGMLILDGNLMINSIDGGYFKVNLYVPAQVTIEELFDGMTLNQIAPHEKYINTLSDINAINTEVLNGTGDGHVCYPYLLYGPAYNNDDELEGKQDIRDNFLNVNNIYPSFNVLSVIKDIFKTKGYNVEGNIFNDNRFSGLYQTYQADDADTYNSKKNSPYYLGFKGDYRLYNGSNISSTAKREDLYSDGTYFKWYRGWDTMLLSENSTLRSISNDYDMLNKGAEGGYVITVPKSGWYKISCDGTVSLPSGTYGSIISENDKVNVSYGSNYAEADLEHQPIEFVIKKGTPLQNCTFYTFNSSVPCMPTIYTQDDTITNEKYTLDKMPSGTVYLKNEDNSRQNYFGKNNKTTYIKNIGEGDVSDLIVGARWGSTANINHSVIMSMGNFIGQSESERYERICHIALPRTDMTPTRKTISGKTYYPLYELKGQTNKYPMINRNYTYGYETAQAFALEGNNYFNFDGYNFYNINTNKWDTTSNYKKKNPIGSRANEVKSTNKTSGTYKISNVVWLNEGETISIELSIPAVFNYNYGQPTSKGAVCLRDIMLSFDFKMGLINSNEDWEPSVNSPIPTDDELDDRKKTNLNELLPEIGCNEYLNNFLQTFNLKMTKKDNATYSIDSNTSNIIGKTIDLDPYFNIQDASFSRLDLPTRKVLKWTINVDEEGYVSSGYDGSKVYENPTNTMENEVSYTSAWSYTWYKDIEFVEGNKSKGKYSVPILCTHKDYLRYPSNAYSDGINPSMTMRLFYIGGSIGMYYENTYYNLIIPKKYNDELFLIDYGKPIDAENYSNISDAFFNVNLSTQYQIDIPMILPNRVYDSIRKDSIARVNNGLYKFISIDGHDISEADASTVSLISLK